MNTIDMVAGTREVTTIAGVEVAWRHCPAGTYTMGSPADERDRFDDEEQHLGEIAAPFWIMETPVTQALYAAVLGENPSRLTDDDRRPVENVSWNEAFAFADRMGARLPTEEEWEYACRAGSTGARYGDLDAVAWYRKNSGGTTHPVGEKTPNAWCIYDMLGNVWEWTGTVLGSYRVFRGGSWASDARSVRAAFRLAGTPGNRGSSLGFRLARGLAPSPASQPDPGASPWSRRAEPTATRGEAQGDDWRVW